MNSFLYYWKVLTEFVVCILIHDCLNISQAAADTLLNFDRILLSNILKSEQFVRSYSTTVSVSYSEKKHICCSHGYSLKNGSPQLSVTCTKAAALTNGLPAITDAVYGLWSWVQRTHRWIFDGLDDANSYS